MKTCPCKPVVTVLACLSLFVAGLPGCNSPDQSAESNPVRSENEENVPGIMPDGLRIIRGVIVAVSAQQLRVKTGDSTITVHIIRPFHVYSREAATLAGLKNKSFIGVTTRRQPDGTELAAEIHIFPEELRGLNEGSNIMNNSAAGNSRMTNGNVSATAGTTAPSRMSNGSVQLTGASSIVVQYQGRKKTVTVPDSIPVTEFRLSAKSLAPGIRVDLIVKKNTDSTFSSSRGILPSK